MYQLKNNPVAPSTKLLLSFIFFIEWQQRAFTCTPNSKASKYTPTNKFHCTLHAFTNAGILLASIAENQDALFFLTPNYGRG
jgi:hypothetical protein